MKNELLKELSEEQIAKSKACKNQEELLKAAKEEGVELSDEQIEVANGGICTSTPSYTCPKCGSSDVHTVHNENSICEYYSNKCNSCGHRWSVRKE